MIRLDALYTVNCSIHVTLAADTETSDSCNRLIRRVVTEHQISVKNFLVPNKIIVTYIHIMRRL